MRTHGFMTAGALFGLVLAAPGCSTPINGASAGSSVLSSTSEKSEVVPARRFEVGGTPRIFVDDRIGNLVVTAGDDGVVVVEAIKRAGTKADLAAIVPEIAEENGTVTVRWSPTEPTLVNRALDVTIRAPKNAALKLETGNGAITVEGFQKGAEAKTGVGAIAVKRAAGALTLHTGNGAIDVEGASGTVKAETGVGSVTLKGTTGARTAHSGNGAILIDGADGAVSAQTQVGSIDVKHAKGDLALSTGNGAVIVNDVEGAVTIETLVGSIDVAGRPSGASRLHSGNGTIDVTLPADSRLTVHASTGNGPITNAFGLPVEGTVTSVCKGTVGDGSGGSLRLETLVGGISLKKK